MNYIVIRNGDYYTFIHRQVPNDDAADSGTEYWQDFMQPTMSENGTIHGDSFAVGSSTAYQGELAWRAFDGDNATQWSSNNQVPARLRWYNPKPLRMSKITITNRNGVGGIIKDYDIQYADKGDDTDWVTLQSGTNTNTTYGGQWDINITHEEAHKHWRIIAKTTQSVGWAGSVSVANCAITATVLMGLKVFNQPNLTANGTWGGDAFACKASSVWSADYDAWKAFNSGDSYWNPKSGATHPHELYFYNPKPLKVSRLGIRTRSNGNSAIKDFEVYASNDDLDYKLIKSDTSNVTAGSKDYWCDIPESAGAYKYWKIKSLNGQGGSASYWVCTYLSIEAKEVVEYSEITPNAFVQPKLTANGTLGGTSFAVESSSYGPNSASGASPAYGAFDGNGSTYWRSDGTNESITFYNPNPLKVKSLTITPFYKALTSCTVEGSNTNGEWKQLATITPPTTVTEFTVNVNSDTAYKYHRLVLTVDSDKVHLAEVKIDADVVRSVDVVERSYCVKYPVFLHPDLKANGTVGGASFAVEASSYGNNNLPECLPAYGAFDGNDSTYWRAGSNEAWITFYNPTPIKLKSLTVSPYFAPVTSVNIEGSNTNDGWVFVGASAPNTVEKFNVDVGSNTAYKYHRVKFVVSKDVVHVLDMKIEASV